MSTPTLRTERLVLREPAPADAPAVLVFRVSARAVDGKATEAALAAVAGSFGVRRGAVRLVSGATSRTKVIDIEAGDPRILATLLAAPGPLPLRMTRCRGRAGQAGRGLPAATPQPQCPRGY